MSNRAETNTRPSSRSDRGIQKSELKPLSLCRGLSASFGGGGGGVVGLWKSFVEFEDLMRSLKMVFLRFEKLFWRILGGFKDFFHHEVFMESSLV